MVTTPSDPAPDGVPRVRCTAFIGLKAAAEELWGRFGVRDIVQRLPGTTRQSLYEEILMPQAWLPEQHVIDFCRAVWDGPAMQAEGPYSSFLARSAFHGWGRFQKIVLSLVSPEALAARAPSLWRRDHSHGTLATELMPYGAVISLSEHPYTETEFARAMIAETFRQLLGMTRVPVRSRAAIGLRHALDGERTLRVQLSWQ